MDTKTPAAAAAPAAKVQKARRSFGTLLRDGQGNSMRIIARARDDGSAISFVKHTMKGTDGKKHSKRGMTDKHTNIEDAKVARDEKVAIFLADGWKTSTRVSTFEPKGDAFTKDNRPKPVLAAAPTPAPAPAAKAAATPAKK